MRRKTFSVLVFPVFAAGLVLATGRAEAEEPVSLRFWNVPDRSNRSIPAMADLAVYDAFFFSHPDIDMERISALHAPPTQSESADLMAMAGGTAPDVLVVFPRRVQSYIEQNFLLPLDDFIEPGYIESLDVPPQLWQVVKGDGHIYSIVTESSLMGLKYRRDLFAEVGLDPNHPPDNWDELFDFAQRLTFPEKKLKRSSLEAGIQQGQKGLGITTGFLGGWQFINFVWQGGGDIVRKYRKCPACGITTEARKEDTLEKCPDCGQPFDPKASPVRWKVTYDEEPGIKALRFYKKLRWARWKRCPKCQEPCNAPALTCPECGDTVYVTEPVERVVCPVCKTEIPVPSERRVLICEQCNERVPWEGKWEVGVIRHGAGVELMGGALLQGQLAMAIGLVSQEFFDAALREGIRPDLIAFASLPAGPTGVRANFVGGSTLGINSAQKDPEVQQAAWKFIQFWASDEAKKIRAETFIRNGWGTMVNPEWLKKFGYMEYYEEIPENIREAYAAIAKYGRVEPFCPGYENVQTTELATPIDTVMTDESADPVALLKESARRVNANIMGVRDEAKMQRRRTIGWIALALGGSGIIVIFWFIIRDLQEKYKVAAEGARRGLSVRRHVAAWLFLLPALLSILLWQYIPLFRGSVMAFYDYKLLADSIYIGIDNFVNVFADPFFYKVVWNTVFYVFLSLLIGFGLPIFLAILLSEIPWGKMFFRTVYYLPAVTTGLVIMFLWKDIIFNPERTGTLNVILQWFGLERRDWLNDPYHIINMLVVILPGVWAGAGPGSIIYIAALKTVPEEYYESADLDGAGFWRKIWFIALPILKPLVIINFVGAFIGSFHAAQNVFVMTGGGPANKTLLIGLDIWYNAFLYLKFGYATAMAWILGATLIGFTMYQLRILKKVEFTTAKSV